MQWRSSKKNPGRVDPTPPTSNRHRIVKPSPPEHSPAPTPSRAVYGFLLYLLSNLSMLLYFVWALLPDPVLQQVGLDFLPQKYWAVAIPIFVSCLFITFVLFIYPALGRLHCRGIDSSGQLTDRHAIPRMCAEKAFVEGGVPPVYDMSLHEIHGYLRKTKISEPFKDK